MRAEECPSPSKYEDPGLLFCLLLLYLVAVAYGIRTWGPIP